jgi:hypothetical protein
VSIAVVAFRPPAALAPVSDGLASAIYLAESDPDGVVSGRHTFPAQVVDEARAGLDLMASARPAGPREIYEWLTAVVDSVRNPPTREDAQKRAAHVSAACSDLPADLFTAAALKAGMRKWEFWPSVADVRAVVLETAPDWTARKRSLAAVAASRAASPRPDGGGRQEPTTDERAAVSAAMAAYLEEVKAGQADEKAERAPARPCKPIDPEALKAMRDGNHLVQKAKAARDAIQREQAEGRGS